jgi:hypothetical protein
VNRSREAAVLLACVATASLVFAALAMNVARLGSAVAREVERAQTAYMHHTGSGEPAEHNAMLLGHCLRREMLRSARAGLLDPDAWAITARIRALPGCTRMLPAIPPPHPAVITAPRVRAIITSAPMAGPAVQAPNSGRSAVDLRPTRRQPSDLPKATVQ